MPRLLTLLQGLVLCALAVAHPENMDGSSLRLPVMFIPPLTGVELQAKLHKSRPSHFSWCPTMSDWTTLWISPSILVPGVFSCFVEDMKVKFSSQTMRSQSAEGVSVRPTHGFEKTLNPLAPLIWDLERRGWQWEKQLQAHIYDWRLTPNDWASDLEYGWPELQKSIEELRMRNGGRRVCLVAISMGSTYISSFLHSFVSQQWKDANVAAFFSISGVFGGTPTATQGIISGRLEGLELLFNKMELQDLMRSIPALSWLNPHTEVYGKQVLVENVALAQTYSAMDLDQALKGAGASDAAAAWKQVFSFPSHLSPNVTTFCLYSKGLKTLTSLKFRSETFEDDPEISYTDGDTTVPLPGLQAACDSWAKLPGHPVYSRIWENVGHAGLLQARGAVAYVVQNIIGLGVKEVKAA